MTTTTTRYRLKGVNDEASECSLCGRSGLKRVAWLAELDEDGNEVSDPAHYGTDCAGLLLTGRKDRKNTEMVRETGERLDRVRRQLAKGYEPKLVAADWIRRTCWEARPEGEGVRVYWGDQSWLITA